MLILSAAITVGLLVSVILFALNYSTLLGGSTQHLTAVEAAALEAVKQASRVVVEHPRMGFISLSACPPIGLGTRVGDGQPMPVRAINGVVARARLDLIIAKRWGNPTFIALAEQQVRDARDAVDFLNNRLQAYIQEGNRDARDLQGKTIDIYGNARRVYEANLNNMTLSGRLSNFRLSLGKLATPGGTLTKIPQPEDLSQVPNELKQDGNYKSCINIPAEGSAFYFGAIGRQPALVSALSFAPLDSLTPCSIIKIEADHTISPSTQGEANAIKSTACAQPAINFDYTEPSGIMTLSFPHGIPRPFVKVRDLFESPEFKTRGKIFTAEGGDWPWRYPRDPNRGGYLVPITVPGLGENPTVPQMACIALFNWAQHGDVNIRSFGRFLDQEFRSIPGTGNEVTAHRFDYCLPAYAGPRDTIPTTIMAALDIERHYEGLQEYPVPAAMKAAYERFARNDSVSAVAPNNGFNAELNLADYSLTNARRPFAFDNLERFQKMVINGSNTAAAVAATLGDKVASDPNSTAEERQRATNALANAREVMDESFAITNRQKDGTLRVNGNRFVFNGQQVNYRPLPPANVEAIKSGNCPTGNPDGKNWTDLTTNNNFYYDGRITAGELDFGEGRMQVRQGVNLFMVEMDRNGNIVIANNQTSPAKAMPVHEGQLFAVCYHALQEETTIPEITANWNFVMRDACYRYAGRHKDAGAPPKPVDSCRIDEEENDARLRKNEQLAANKNKGESRKLKCGNARGRNWYEEDPARYYGQWKDERGDTLPSGKQPNAIEFSGPLIADLAFTMTHGCIIAGLDTTIVPTASGYASRNRIGPAIARPLSEQSPLRIPNTMCEWVYPGGQARNSAGLVQATNRGMSPPEKVRAQVPKYSL